MSLGGLDDSIERCPGEVVITQEGYVVCSSTGEVLDVNIISDEPERMFKDDGRSVSRVGDPITFTQHDLGIGVTLRPQKPSNPLKRTSGILAKRIKEARVAKKDIYKVSILKKANEIASILALSKTAKEDIGYIINSYLDKEKISGVKEQRCIVAAVILKIIEKYNLCITKNEVLELLDVDQECVWDATNKLYSKGVFSKINRHIYTEGGSRRLVDRVETYINRLVSDLKLEDSVKKDALEFLRVALKSGKTLYGKKPETVAAAIVYLVARLHGYENISQSTVAERVKIKESNVRKLYRYLMDGMVVMVPL
ncbi:MAG: transcription initiation factor IIB family protein [Acidilobaceae archaeon]